MSQNNVTEIPSFLKQENVPNFTKPNEEAQHEEKLIEIVNGLDVRDAVIICEALAKKYPEIMGRALGDATKELIDKINGINHIIGGIEDDGK